MRGRLYLSYTNLIFKIISLLCVQSGITTEVIAKVLDLLTMARRTLSSAAFYAWFSADEGVRLAIV